MPNPTNTQKIEDIARRIARQEDLFSDWQRIYENNTVEIWEELKSLRSSVEQTNQRLSVLEERSRALEKHSDRSWQLVPLIISALAILVSLIVAFVKK